MRHCLILDDSDLEGTISGFSKRLLNNDMVEYDQLDLSTSLNEKFEPSVIKLINTVKAKLLTKRYDLFACDMYLGENIIGYDILRETIKDHPQLLTILYSGDFQSLAGILATRISDNANTESPKDALRALTRITDFTDRTDDLEDRIIAALNTRSSVYQIIAAKLSEHPEAILRIGFSKFHNKKFKDIARDVDNYKNNANALKFVDDVIERSIHHMMELNGE